MGKFICVVLAIVFLLIPLSPALASDGTQLRLNYTPDPRMSLRSISGVASIIETESTADGTSLSEVEVYIAGQDGLRATIEIVLRKRTNPSGHIKELEIGYYVYIKDGSGYIHQYSGWMPADYGVPYEWQIITQFRDYPTVFIRGPDKTLVYVVGIEAKKIYRVSMSLEYFISDGFSSDSRFTIKEAGGRSAVEVLTVDGDEPYYGGSHIGYGINSLNEGAEYYYNALRCGF